MHYFVLTGLGILLGGLDIFPMIKQKLDPFSIASAFVFHMIMPFLVNAIAWDFDRWIAGGCFYLIMAIPLMILAAKDDKKAVPMMAVSSCILGCICGYCISLL